MVRQVVHMEEYSKILKEVELLRIENKDLRALLGAIPHEVVRLHSEKGGLFLNNPSVLSSTVRVFE